MLSEFVIRATYSFKNSCLCLCQVQASKPAANFAADCVSIKKIKIFVAKKLDKHLPMTHFTKVSVCFDPVVRDTVLSRDECSQLDLKTFHELSKFNERSI